MLWRILQKEVVPRGAPPTPAPRVPVLGVGWEDGPGLLFF